MPVIELTKNEFISLFIFIDKVCKKTWKIFYYFYELNICNYEVLHIYHKWLKIRQCFLLLAKCHKFHIIEEL